MPPAESTHASANKSPANGYRENPAIAVKLLKAHFGGCCVLEQQGWATIVL